MWNSLQTHDSVTFLEPEASSKDAFELDWAEKNRDDKDDDQLATWSDSLRAKDADILVKQPLNIAYLARLSVICSCMMDGADQIWLSLLPCLSLLYKYSAYNVCQ